MGWIYLLPTDTQKVLVKYAPKWLISCVLPDKRTTSSFRVKKYIDDEETWIERSLEINIPTLILSHSFVKPWVEKSAVEQYFLLHAAEISDASIRAAMFRLANVYSSGKLCFGEISNEGLPSNLRKANSLFWGTPFNDDASPFYDLHSMKCSNKSHENYEHQDEEFRHSCAFEREHQCACDSTDGNHRPGCECATEDCGCECVCACCVRTCNCECKCECCLNVCGCACNCELTEQYFDWIHGYAEQLRADYAIKTQFFLGDRYIGYNQPTSALFLSNDPKLEEWVPPKFWREDGQKHRFILGSAIDQLNQTWRVDLGQLQFEIPRENISIV